MSSNISETPTETDLEEDESSEDALPRYGPWVSFYGFFHRLVGRRFVLFGGSAAVGLLVLVRQFYAFVFEPSEWAGLPPWSVLSGVFLFGFGVGYYAVRDDTACNECDTPFSKERVSKRPIRRDSEKSSRVYIRETLECQSCGNHTTEVYQQPEKNPPRF
ncbi:hypothetical protein [Halorussus caseinilyticus]|uniref:Uncharacterized protein n=1 Tax=Halorussus caseinilyticus TaxID=3034025 RepID=A0ABD5WK43_9EURY|nr:hypothetical protein [Halorussus sp. DT72]